MDCGYDDFVLGVIFGRFSDSGRDFQAMDGENTIWCFKNVVYSSFYNDKEYDGQKR